MTTITVHIEGDGEAVIPPTQPRTTTTEDARLDRVGARLAETLRGAGIAAEVVFVGTDAIGPEWDERQAIPSFTVADGSEVDAARILAEAFPDVVEVYVAVENDGRSDSVRVFSRA